MKYSALHKINIADIDNSCHLAKISGMNETGKILHVAHKSLVNETAVGEEFMNSP